MLRKPGRKLNPRTNGRMGNMGHGEWILPMRDANGKVISLSAYEDLGFTNVTPSNDWPGFYLLRAPHNIRGVRWGFDKWRVYRNFTHVLTYTVYPDGSSFAVIQPPNS